MIIMNRNQYFAQKPLYRKSMGLTKSPNETWSSIQSSKFVIPIKILKCIAALRRRLKAVQTCYTTLKSVGTNNHNNLGSWNEGTSWMGKFSFGCKAPTVFARRYHVDPTYCLCSIKKSQSKELSSFAPTIFYLGTPRDYSV